MLGSCINLGGVLFELAAGRLYPFGAVVGTGALTVAVTVAFFPSLLLHHPTPPPAAVANHRANGTTTAPCSGGGITARIATTTTTTPTSATAVDEQTCDVELGEARGGGLAVTEGAGKTAEPAPPPAAAQPKPSAAAMKCVECDVELGNARGGSVTEGAAPAPPPPPPPVAMRDVLRTRQLWLCLAVIVLGLLPGFGTLSVQNVLYVGVLQGVTKADAAQYAV